MTTINAPAIGGIVIGDGSSNIIIGSDCNDREFGLACNDTLNGYGGDDMLYGGDGNDKLYGGLGNDYHDGGAGIDTAYFEFTKEQSTITIGANGGAVYLAHQESGYWVTETVLSNVECLSFNGEVLSFEQVKNMAVVCDDQADLIA